MKAGHRMRSHSIFLRANYDVQVPMRSDLSPHRLHVHSRSESNGLRVVEGDAGTRVR
jgi:hypothetical protein